VLRAAHATACAAVGSWRLTICAIGRQCRDTAQIADMTIPVWCTSIRPISGTANKIYETQVPVSCGGVAVDPGDWVFGDADGIIVGSRAEIEPLLPTAEAIVRNEDAAVAAMHRCVQPS
jgi:4-hydroxy-4-methyl-2-oxoglutarate aldolase